jgi:hypothetical protein
MILKCHEAWSNIQLKSIIKIKIYNSTTHPIDWTGDRTTLMCFFLSSNSTNLGIHTFRSRFSRRGYFRKGGVSHFQREDYIPPPLVERVTWSEVTWGLIRISALSRSDKWNVTNPKFTGSTLFAKPSLGIIIREVFLPSLLFPNYVSSNFLFLFILYIFHSCHYIHLSSFTEFYSYWKSRTCYVKYHKQLLTQYIYFGRSCHP